ncbi:MAG: hypothetical protein KF791_20395 [Verrucomicrobiae bacterium]|nr:hypothetical protein [Verrucomicrobiae bacterium]
MFTFITLIMLATIASAIWILTPAKLRQQDKILQTQFDQLQGYTGDPVIQTLRDTGPDAVAFLARQMKRKDSVLLDWYVALWPKLPVFIKSKLKQPVNATTIRVKAVGALRQMGTSFTGSEIGLVALTNALSHPDIELRSRAEGALGDLGPKAKDAVPALIECVAAGTNINGVWALGRIGPDAKAALPILEFKMRQGTGRERVYAAGAVWKIGGENTEARIVIKEALENPDRHIRIDAENVLVESPEICPQ